MTHWIRFGQDDRVGFRTLGGGTISIRTGDMFGRNEPTGEKIDFAALKVLIPCIPGKMICLWNNFGANATKQNLPKPAEPLWFIKASSSYLAQGEAIRRPPSYRGKVIYEGELGIVIGKECSN